MEEEEKIITNKERTERKQNIPNQTNRITDARSESRKEFTKIKLEDPMKRLQELPLKQAKERRQNIIEENRTKRIEENKMIQIEQKNYNNPIAIQTMIKEITKALNLFIESTNKEIENIKEIINLNLRGQKKEHEEFKTHKTDIDHRIQNILISQKEINQKWDAIGSLVEGMIEGESSLIKTTQNNISYSKYKKDLAETNRKHQPITKAILYDKYIPNKARIVTAKEKDIKTYRVTISHKFNKRIYYVNYRGKWQRLRDIIEQLSSEGLIYGFRNIIKTLRSRYLRKNKIIKREQTPEQMNKKHTEEKHKND